MRKSASKLETLLKSFGYGLAGGAVLGGGTAYYRQIQDAIKDKERRLRRDTTSDSTIVIPVQKKAQTVLETLGIGQMMPWNNYDAQKALAILTGAGIGAYGTTHVANKLRDQGLKQKKDRAAKRYDAAMTELAKEANIKTANKNSPLPNINVLSVPSLAWLLSTGAIGYGGKRYLDYLAEKDDKKQDLGPNIGPPRVILKSASSSQFVKMADIRAIVAIDVLSRTDQEGFLSGIKIKQALKKDNLTVKQVKEAVSKNNFSSLIKTAAWKTLRIPFSKYAMSLPEYFKAIWG